MAALLALVLSTPGVVAAQESATSKPAPAVVPLLEGEPAPFLGLLVSPERFEGYLTLQAQAEAAAQKLAARDAAIADAEHRAALAETQARGTWFQRNAFWLGLGAGVVGTVALVVVVSHSTQR